MRILIADDDRSMRFILKVQLENWGFEVISCKDGNEAMEHLLSEHPPRIAILDWMMQGYTGVEIAERLNGRIPLIYVILLTSKTAEEDLVVAIDKGAHCFQSKPVSPGVLKSHIAVARRLIEAEDLLQEQEKEIRIQCYQALADLGESRHDITGSHMKRIGIYSRILAEQLGMPEQWCSDLELFSTFHDIGKVGLSDTILMKPDAYSKYEKEIMKAHVVLGYEILSNVTTLQTAALIARHHHERWDGKGYPDGLAGEDIPLEARIVTMADIYDALRSQREYKDPWSHNHAVSFIVSESGTIFDPHLVELFLEIQDRFQQVYEQEVFSKHNA